MSRMPTNSISRFLLSCNRNLHISATAMLAVLTLLFFTVTVITLTPKIDNTSYIQYHITHSSSAPCSADSRVIYASHSPNGWPIYTDLKLSRPALREDICLKWGNESDIPLPDSNTSINVRYDHPRLFATSYRWRQLPSLIEQDPYLRLWNGTIIHQAHRYYSMPPVEYYVDGGLSEGGVLDTSRKLQLRVKYWAYAYRTSKDSRWVDRVWEELVVASGNSTTRFFGVPGDNWNTKHWLDVGEFLTTFAIAYDWLYDAWTTEQRDSIMWSIISLGLKKGLEAYGSNVWFLSVNGNWNCVTNAGIIIGSLAVYHDDPTGTAARLLALAIPNAKQNCASAVLSDGTWAETPDYWYFGVQGHAQMASALLTATGSTHDLLTASPAFHNTSLYHVYSNGMTGNFNYGDCGPQKYTATANAMLFYGDQYAVPMFTLYQRDFAEAADPLSMFWYNPQVTGRWYMGLALDYNFPNLASPWVSMRSSWTDRNGIFAAMKAGPAVGHQTHGNIDAGDFVLDALGERWAGELCQASYLSTGYFSSEAQNSTRWLYYRTRTEGQNTITYNASNQVVDATMPLEPRFETTGDVQAEYTTTQPRNDSAAVYWIANLTASYGGTHIQRGMRLFHGRRDLLIQDEIVSADATSQWRMHTNATITYSKGNKVANLALHGKLLAVTLQSPPGSTFRTVGPIRLPSSPGLPEGETDPENVGVSVLAINIPAGTHTVAVVFSPLWTETFDTVVPALVALDKWTLQSHLIT